MESKKHVNERIDKAYQEYAREHFNNSIKSDSITLIGVVFGSVLQAVTLVVLLRAGGMISAGINGLVMLIQRISETFFSLSLPFAPLSIVLNAFPAYLCFRFVGKRFALFSCISLLLVSVMVDLIPPYVLTDDRLLIAVFGGILNGFGGGLILRSGACSGGTDFIAMYFGVKKGINTFNTVFICNSCLIVISGLLFGMESAMYTIIFQFIQTQMINFMYQRYAKKTLFIVTEKPHEVADAVMMCTRHSCTIFKSAEGSYSGEPRFVVYTIVGATEINTVRKFIKGTDPNAFINTLDSDSVSGAFFQRPLS